MKFNELNLKEAILKALNELKYETTTPIQEKTIPMLLEGKDVIGCAQTGSGKTAAFSLPILQKLAGKKEESARALIMAPTRELAMQICENIRYYSKYLDLTAVAIYGGVNQDEQVAQLEAGVDVIVATPGRLLDLRKQGYVKLDKIEMLVLDEADRMLDMGFINDILFLVCECPKDCQKLMFSATMPKPIERLADRIFDDPEMVMQDKVTSTVDTVQQFVYYVDQENKLPLLASILKSKEVKKAIVFTNTRNTAEHVTKHLMSLAIRSRAIHSEKSQASRQDAIVQFQKNHIKVLVATDVAARGIDINKVSHVINFDIPERGAESYIHRIGRTGRAGEEGVAINLVCIDQMDDFRSIEEHIKMTIPQLKSEWPMTIFQKKKKPVKKKEEAVEDPFDIKKVKDVSLSGKPMKKRSNYQYHQQKMAKGKGQSQSEGKWQGRGNGKGQGRSKKVTKK